MKVVTLTTTKKKQCYINSIYIFFLCLNTFFSVIRSSNITLLPLYFFFDVAQKLLSYSIVFLFLLNKTVKKKKLSFLIFISVFIFINVFSIGSNQLLFIFLIFLTFPHDLSSYDVAKWESRTIFFAVSCVILLYLLGCIKSESYYRGTILRKACGFTTPNALSNTVLFGIIIYIYYKYDRWKLKNLLLLLLISFFIYFLTNSRMALCTELILIFVVQLWKIKKSRIVVWPYRLVCIIFPTLMCFCYLLVYLFQKNSKIVQILNIILSHRLGYMQEYLLKYGITPFGRKIDFVSFAESVRTGKQWLGLDNSYFYILIVWGSVLSFVLFIGYFLLGKELQKRQDRIGALCAIIFCIVGITENTLGNISFNFTLILFVDMLNHIKMKNKIYSLIL